MIFRCDRTLICVILEHGEVLEKKKITAIGHRKSSSYYTNKIKMRYTDVNHENWNDRAKCHHESSEVCNLLEKLRRGQSTLRETKIDLLGEVKGKKILHLNLGSSILRNIPGVTIKDILF